MELIKQSLLDLKQCATSIRVESDLQDPLHLEDEREPMNRMRVRTNDESRRRGKRKVRDNKPNDWNAPW